MIGRIKDKLKLLCFRIGGGEQMMEAYEEHVEGLSKQLEDALSETSSDLLKRIFHITPYDYEQLDTTARQSYMRQISEFYNSTAWKNEFNAIAAQLNYGMVESETIEQKNNIRRVLEFVQSLDGRWREISSLLDQETMQQKEEREDKDRGVPAYRDIL